MPKKAKRPEQIRGLYSAVPHDVQDSAAYKEASHTAIHLLHDLTRQHNGVNNGHLHLAAGWLKNRGWRSADVIQRAKQELADRGLIIKTRSGGLNSGPDLWALNWLPISDPRGLDVRQTDRTWAFFSEPQKQEQRSDARNNAVPATGTGIVCSAPSNGSKCPPLSVIAAPPDGNNVNSHVPRLRGAKRIVGKAGKSGVPRTKPT